MATAAGSILQRILLKHETSHPVAYSIVFQFLVALFMAIFTVFHGFHLPDFILYWPNVLLMIFLYSVTNVLVFHSLKLIQASEFTIFFATRAVWTIIIAVTFLREHFLSIQILGTVLVLFSVVLVSLKEKKFVFNKGVVFALLSACTIGIAFANDAYILRTSDAATYLVFSFSLPAFATLLAYPKSVVYMRHFFQLHMLIKMLLFSLFSAMSAITVYLAYQRSGNAAEIGVIAQLATIATVLFAIIFLKETTHVLRKIIGSTIAFIGVVLIGG